MKRKAVSAVAILMIISVLLCSCTKKADDSAQTSPDSNSGAVSSAVTDIVLPYSSSDSLNPYFATGSDNLALAFLFCQPLFEVKADYSPEAVLASDYSLDATTVTVTIKPTTFSDGSSLSAKDVVYSFNKAKASATYGIRLQNISSAKASGNSVVFGLATPDVFALNVLSFPVVKSGTADSADKVPTGSGSFILSDEKTMTINPNSQVSSAINTIKLYDVKKRTYITNELEIGNINYLFEDFSEGNYKRIVAQNKTVTLNNFVYLGFNSAYGALASSAVRTAIYYAIDKDDVSASAYQGYAKATATPFNPDFCQLAGVTAPDIKGDSSKCKSILEKIGYSRYSKRGARTNGTNDLEFSILVNSENSFRVAAAYKIVDNLAPLGIVAKVEAVDSAVYQQRIASGNFQMYLGEVKLTENMDLSVFLSGQASAGVDKTAQFINDYSAFREGTIDMQNIVSSFMNDTAFVPICYRCGMAAYSKAYNPDFSYAPFNIYGNIENWEKIK